MMYYNLNEEGDDEMFDEYGSLLQCIDNIEQNEIDAITSVAESQCEYFSKRQQMIQEGCCETTEDDFVQEGVIGAASFLTDKLPIICDFFSRKFKNLFSRYKIAELRKENDKLRYQLDSQNARIESLERAMGGKAAVQSGGDVTFAYDYDTVSKLMTEVKKRFDKLDLDLSDSSISRIENVIAGATEVADKAVRTIKESKAVKMTMSTAGEAINKGLDTVASVPEMLQTLKSKAVKQRNAVRKGKVENAPPGTEQRLNGIISGLTGLLGKVSGASAKQLQETDRVQKGGQRKVTSSNHQAVIGKKIERAKEQGDFKTAKKISTDDAKARAKAVGKKTK